MKYTVILVYTEELYSILKGLKAPVSYHPTGLIQDTQAYDSPVFLHRPLDLNTPKLWRQYGISPRLHKHQFGPTRKARDCSRSPSYMQYSGSIIAG